MLIPPVAAIVFPIESRLPSATQMSDWTDEMVSERLAGFSWADIGPMMQECAEYMEEAGFHLNREEKKRLSLQILNQMLDQFRIVFLPTPFFDPLFQEMVPHFAFLVFPHPIPQARLQKQGSPDNAAYQKKAETLVSSLPPKVDWSVIGVLFLSAIHFTLEYSGMDAEEKAAAVRTLADETLNQIDPSRLPAHFNLSVLHQMVDPMIDSYFGISGS